MLPFILAYLGGALTIVSPCILPVLPFVFARVGQPFLRSTSNARWHGSDLGGRGNTCCGWWRLGGAGQ